MSPQALFEPFLYLTDRFFSAFKLFFRHWYLDGSLFFYNQGKTLFRNLEQTLALELTVRHFFEPLYHDYTPMGRALGFLFRPLRILLALFLYFFFGLIFTASYLFWILLPPVIVLQGFF